MKEEFSRQKKFTEKVLGVVYKLPPYSDSDKVKLTKEYVLSLIAECTEILNALDWKMQWSNEREVNPSNIAFEIIDIQKFLFGLASIWGISYQQYVDIFRQKSDIVESKFDQEQAIKGPSSKTCIIDIDGVLCDFPRCYYDWAFKELGYSEEILKNNKLIHAKAKHLYRSSGAKKFLPVKEGVKEALDLIHSLGYRIILLTKRPHKEYANIYYDTIFWLKNNSLVYDFIFWSEGEIPKIISAFKKTNKIDFIVDDSLETCVDFSKIGVKSYLVSDKEVILDKIKAIEGLGDIDEIN